MINLINRNDSEEIGVSSNYSMMRFWSPEFVIKNSKVNRNGVEQSELQMKCFVK